MARRFLACGDIEYALIVGTEILSRLTNYEDRSTCVLFGDGAGATVVRAADALYGASLGADGTGYGPLPTTRRSRTLFTAVRKVPGIWSWAGARSTNLRQR